MKALPRKKSMVIQHHRNKVSELEIRVSFAPKEQASFNFVRFLKNLKTNSALNLQDCMQMYIFGAFQIDITDQQVNTRFKVQDNKVF